MAIGDKILRIESYYRTQLFKYHASQKNNTLYFIFLFPFNFPFLLCFFFLPSFFHLSFPSFSTHFSFFLLCLLFHLLYFLLSLFFISFIFFHSTPPYFDSFPTFFFPTSPLLLPWLSTCLFLLFLSLSSCYLQFILSFLPSFPLCLLLFSLF